MTPRIETIILNFQDPDFVGLQESTGTQAGKTSFSYNDVDFRSGGISMRCQHSGDLNNKDLCIRYWKATDGNSIGEYTLRFYEGDVTFTFKSQDYIIKGIVLNFNTNFPTTNVPAGWTRKSTQMIIEGLSTHDYSAKFHANSSPTVIMTTAEITYEVVDDDEDDGYEFPQDKLTPVIGEQSLKRTMLIVADGMTHEINKRRQEFIDVRASIPVAFNDESYQNYGGGLVSVGPGGDRSLGNEADVVGSIALGRGAKAKGNPSIAIGSEASAEGNPSIAIGVDVTASRTNSIVIGNNSTSSNEGGIAIGINSKAEGFNSLAIHSHTKQDGEVAIGCIWSGDPEKDKPLLSIRGKEGGKMFIYGAQAKGPEELDNMSLQEYLTQDREDWKAADDTLQKNIDAEKTAREAADKKESEDRTKADNKIWEAIDGNVNPHIYHSGSTIVQAIAARIAEDERLLGLINAEASTRETEDNDLSRRITTEEDNRKQEDENIWKAIKTLQEHNLIEIVPELPPLNKAVNDTIYLVPHDKNGSSSARDMYAEWVVVNGNWEKFGDFIIEVDLKNYWTSAEVEKEIDKVRQALNSMSGSITQDFRTTKIVDSRGDPVSGISLIDASKTASCLNFEAKNGIKLSTSGASELLQHISIEVNEDEFMESINLDLIKIWLGDIA